MVEDNYIDGQEAAFGAFNFKLTRPETYDEIQVTEEYQEPATLIRSLKDHEKANRSYRSKQSGNRPSSVLQPSGSKLSTSSINDSFTERY